ncbi:thermonuclease family protein [Candidatus Omnitrophota bacterium]
MKNKRILILVIVFVAISFLIVRFLPHTGIGKEDYRDVHALCVIDGDTIELSNREKVRYIGIDTPELNKKYESGWVYEPMPYAELARDLNKKLIEGRLVRLEFDVQKRDKYNRLLAYVYSGDKMVNLEMVREGYAMIYTYPPNVKYMEEFLDAQKEARERKKGLWGDLEENILSSSEAKEHIGSLRAVETEVVDTYLSERVLILNCRDNFKIAIFRNNLTYFPKMAMRSPDGYFKHKTIRVYGVIKDYKGSPEIVLNDASQLEIL